MKENQEHITRVIFRKDKDTKEVIAFMPYDIADLNGNITSYQHIGQHGAASISYYHTTIKCPQNDFKALLSELEHQVGYRVQIDKKINYRAYNEAVNDLLKTHLNGN